MVFHKFNRKLFVKIETTEGTYSTPAAANYVEVISDISYTLTPMVHERDLVRPSFASIPDLASSDGMTTIDTVVSQVDLTFTVEMAAPSANSANTFTTAPAWGTLLKACCFEELATVEYIGISGSAVTGGPFYTREQTTATTNQKAVSTIFTGDSDFYYTGTTPSSTSLTGDVSSASATLTGTAKDGDAIAYIRNTDKGVGDGSSVSMLFDIDGRQIQVKGARGSVSFAMVAMDRVLMTFNMTGILNNAANATAPTGISYAHSLPAIFVGAGLRLREASGSTDFTGALFEQITLDVGNEVVMRPDANSSSGWKSAQIVGASPTMTLNPDAIAGGSTSASVFDFWQKFVAGTECRASWEVGAGKDGKSFLFKAPALQFDGVADGDRDNFAIYDATAKLTGGTNGDSVDSAGTAQLFSDKGSDNELAIVCT